MKAFVEYTISGEHNNIKYYRKIWIQLIFTIEALDKNDQILEVCTKDLLGWTVEETETNCPVCSFIHIRKAEFTGKEYSMTVAPLP